MSFWAGGATSAFAMAVALWCGPVAADNLDLVKTFYAGTQYSQHASSSSGLVRYLVPALCGPKCTGKAPSLKKAGRQILKDHPEFVRAAKLDFADGASEDPEANAVSLYIPFALHETLERNGKYQTRVVVMLAVEAFTTHSGEAESDDPRFETLFTLSRLGFKPFLTTYAPSPADFREFYRLTFKELADTVLGDATEQLQWSRNEIPELFAVDRVNISPALKTLAPVLAALSSGDAKQDAKLLSNHFAQLLTGYLRDAVIKAGHYKVAVLAPTSPWLVHHALDFLKHGDDPVIVSADQEIPLRAMSALLAVKDISLKDHGVAEDRAMVAQLAARVYQRTSGGSATFLPENISDVKKKTRMGKDGWTYRRFSEDANRSLTIPRIVAVNKALKDLAPKLVNLMVCAAESGQSTACSADASIQIPPSQHSIAAR